MQVRIDLPPPEDRVFRYGAANEILTLVAGSPNRTFTNREFRRITGYGGPSVQNALRLLMSLDLLIRGDQGGRTEYRINSDRIDGPMEGIAALTQTEFHAPIREFRERVIQEVPDLHGIIVFGSVARGEADRKSDIDVFVVVTTAPPMAARRTVADIVTTIEEKRFDGQRYGFDAHVEPIENVRTYGEKIKTIMIESIPIYSTEGFDELYSSFLDELTTTEERNIT